LREIDAVMIYNFLMVVALGVVLGGNAKSFELRAFYPPLDLTLLTYHEANTCVGRPTNPYCALETWRACFTLSQPKLCELVGVSDVTFVSAPISLDNLRETIVDLGIDGVHFGGDRIRHERTLKAEDEAALELPLPWAGAGTVELALSQGRCLPDPGLICLAGEPISQWLFLKPVADTWHVTGWIAGPVEAEALHASDQALEISPDEAQIYWAKIGRAHV